MAIIGDIIRTTLVQEILGVQVINTVYWQVDALGLDQPVLTNVQKIMAYYHAQVTTVVTAEWNLVCCIYENITQGANKQSCSKLS